MDGKKLHLAALLTFFYLSHVTAVPVPPGYYQPPVNYVPPPPYVLTPPAVPMPMYPPPPPNNMAYLPLLPPPPLPPVGPNDLGRPMPAEAAAAVNAPASSYGTQGEHEIEPAASSAADYGQPQTPLLDAYYNGRPSGGSNDVMGGLVGAYFMKEYIF